MTPSFRDLLPLLAANKVEFIVVGGGAAIAHGAGRATYDVDIVYARNDSNLLKLVNALKQHHPYLRGTPAGLPFHWDVQTLKSGLNFTLTTELGDLDLLADIPGGRSYEQLLPYTEELAVFGSTCHFVTLEKLIELKQAAGSPKDLESIAELQALLEE